MHWTKNKKNMKKRIALGLIVAMIWMMAGLSLSLPVSYAMFEGEEYEIDSPFPLTMDIHTSKNSPAYVESSVLNGNLILKAQNEQAGLPRHTATVKLFGIIPIKTVDLSVLPRIRLAPCGVAAGVKMLTEGVIVIGMNDVETKDGPKNPAKEAGLEVRDLISLAEGKKLTSLEDLVAILENGNGEKIELEIKRGEGVLTKEITPVLSMEDNTYKMGIWARDSAAGIGTITFVDTQSGMFGGLGHGICDIDTGQLMTVGEGVLQRTKIEDVKKGERGSPGELMGVFQREEIIGRLWHNSEAGIYGTVEDPFRQEHEGQELEIALKNEIETGPAQIMANVEGDKTELFSIEITKLDITNKNNNKNMLICVTDERLLEKTGGIVQGMSGSPIIQNGKLVGAVTHVLINDPGRGYAIFIENMLETVQNLKITSSEKGSSYAVAS